MQAGKENVTPLSRDEFLNITRQLTQDLGKPEALGPENGFAKSLGMICDALEKGIHVNGMPG